MSELNIMNRLERADVIDFRDLRSVRQIADESMALSRATLERWMFHRRRNGLVHAVVEIDANTYLNLPSFNAWLYCEKDYVGDFRQLLRVPQVLASCALPESKLRHWLKFRSANGLAGAVIVKKHRQQGMLLIDQIHFNRWLHRQNQNERFAWSAGNGPGR